MKRTFHLHANSGQDFDQTPSGVDRDEIDCAIIAQVTNRRISILDIFQVGFVGENGLGSKIVPAYRHDPESILPKEE